MKAGMPQQTKLSSALNNISSSDLPISNRTVLVTSAVDTAISALKLIKTQPKHYLVTLK